MTDPALARSNMVEGQLRPNKVTDQRIVDAMNAVPRELFVPKALRGVAYVDEDMAVAPGRYIMEPMVLARLLQAADIASDDIVLEIGCATGYATAILARVADTVVAVEEDEALAQGATDNLASLEVANAAVVSGPLNAGYPGEGPYNVIVVGGAVEELNDDIIDQLAEGGRLVAVIIIGGVGKACLYTRVGGIVGRRELFDASVPMLPGFAKGADFTF
ncbi:MAG: protein-L-isoaspartate O-methyltransferase [Sphingomonadales bacterium]